MAEVKIRITQRASSSAATRSATRRFEWQKATASADRARTPTRSVSTGGATAEAKERIRTSFSPEAPSIAQTALQGEASATPVAEACDLEQSAWCDASDASRSVAGAPLRRRARKAGAAKRRPLAWKSVASRCSHDTKIASRATMTDASLPSVSAKALLRVATSESKRWIISSALMGALPAKHLETKAGALGIPTASAMLVAEAKRPPAKTLLGASCASSATGADLSAFSPHGLSESSPSKVPVRVGVTTRPICLRNSSAEVANQDAMAI
mmetsp:Transcript_88448/g.247390  ORF Transcript_88448/g.247390 Transcript_88448/m.247390 type:complete len:270 (+) Transcript_88448:949-1758(+)